MDQEVQHEKFSKKDLSEAVDLDFEEEKESWNVYNLEDGSILKVKLILRGVKRLQKHSPDGTPIYLINSQNIVRVVNVPNNLKAKPKPRTIKPV